MLRHHKLNIVRYRGFECPDVSNGLTVFLQNMNIRVDITNLSCNVIYANRIYNLKNGKQKTCYSGSVGNDGTLLRLELDSGGGLVATSCSNKNICILDFFTGELLANMFGHSEVVTGVKFTHDMRHLVTVSGDG